MHHDRYSVSDPFDPRFKATGVIECEELVIDLQTESESGDLSANLVTFNRAIAAGATPEDRDKNFDGTPTCSGRIFAGRNSFSRRQSRPVHESCRQFSQTLTPSLAWIAPKSREICERCRLKT